MSVFMCVCFSVCVCLCVCLCVSVCPVCVPVCFVCVSVCTVCMSVCSVCFVCVSNTICIHCIHCNKFSSSSLHFAYVPPNSIVLVNNGWPIGFSKLCSCCSWQRHAWFYVLHMLPPPMIVEWVNWLCLPGQGGSGRGRHGHTRNKTQVSLV